MVTEEVLLWLKGTDSEEPAPKATSRRAQEVDSEDDQVPVPPGPSSP